jgi:hypothetical protein
MKTSVLFGILLASAAQAQGPAASFIWRRLPADTNFSRPKPANPTAADFTELMLGGIRAATDSDIVFVRVDDIDPDAAVGETPAAAYEAAIRDTSFTTVPLQGSRISQAIKNLIGPYRGGRAGYAARYFATYGIMGICDVKENPVFELKPAAFDLCPAMAKGVAKPFVQFMINDELFDSGRYYRVTVSKSLVEELTRHEDLGFDPNSCDSEGHCRAVEASDFSPLAGAHSGESAVLSHKLLAARVCSALSGSLAAECGETAPKTEPHYRPMVSSFDLKCPGRSGRFPGDDRADLWPVASGTPTSVPGSAADARQQACGLFRFSFQDMQTSLSVVSPNHPDSSVAGNFAGVSDSRAAAPHSHAFSLSGAVDAAREGPHVVVGMRLMFNASQTVQGDGSSSAGQKVSFQQNQMAVVPYFQLATRKRSVSWSWIALTPIEYMFQPLHPEFLYAYNNPSATSGTATTSGELNFTPRRSYGLSSHVGTRVDGHHSTQGQDNYFEAGYQHVRQSNLLTEIDFANPGKAVVPCAFSASKAATACAPKTLLVGPSTAVSAHYAAAHQEGFYWDFKVTRPLYRGKRRRDLQFSA